MIDSTRVPITRSRHLIQLQMTQEDRIRSLPQINHRVQNKFFKMSFRRQIFCCREKRNLRFYLMKYLDGKKVANKICFKFFQPIFIFTSFIFVWVPAYFLKFCQKVKNFTKSKQILSCYSPPVRLGMSSQLNHLIYLLVSNRHYSLDIMSLD